MTKYGLLILIYFLSLPRILHAQDNYPRDYFSAPLEGPLVVIGTFGEIRADHFHMNGRLTTGHS